MDNTIFSSAFQSVLIELVMQLQSRLGSTGVASASPTGEGITIAGASSTYGSTGGSSGKFADLVDQAARRYDLHPGLINAVIQAESSFNPNSISSAGAQGLMQLMPGTAHSLGVSNPLDPAQNIEGGARYLRQLIDQFGDVKLAVAAYNSGPGAVQRYQGIPPYRETQVYVNRVMEYFSANQWSA
ncbi:MAG: lytic transglycosylase domain-containing protein [Anaerolineaceae bacterium]|nr:lytic transglycosylase domain-containing protein [Anaerolineaceae bacterium]